MADVTGWSLAEFLDMDLDDLAAWYESAKSVHRKSS